MIALNKLSKEIYEGNKTRGFDVKNENVGQTLMLVVSELAEALEADRANRRASLQRYYSEIDRLHAIRHDQLTLVNPVRSPSLIQTHEEIEKMAFEMTIKDTFQD